jgi:DNA-binding MarR family transcriptional regulator
MFRKSLPDFKRQNVEIGRPEPIPERPTAAPAMMPLEPSRSPGFLLWHATLRWQRAVAASLAPLNLTHVQFVLLASTWWLNGRGQSPNQIALAAHAGTDVKMTSQVLRSLERKGLVEREVDPADARARRLRVTQRGARLAPRAIAAVEEVDAEFFADVDPETALDLLTRLAART